MCRLLAYVGSPILAADLLFKPSRSIVRQSFDAKERANGAAVREAYAHGALNADGFGIAFYASMDACESETETFDRVILPCVFLESRPAWNSNNLRRLADKVKAPLFFAHVRAAGPSFGVCDCKTHPFTYGRFSFMHNGEIAGFGLVRRRLLNGLKRDESFNLALAHGATDTAVAFAIFVDQLSSPTDKLSSFQLVQFLKNTIKAICDACEQCNVMGTSKLNFVLTDGLTTIATRYTFDPHKYVPGASLYYASGSSFGPTEQGEEDEDSALMADPTIKATNPVNYRIFHAERRSKMTIIASEPLTDVRSDWVQVPDNHVVIVVPSGEVLCAPFYLRYEPCLRAQSAVAELARVFAHMDASENNIGASTPLMRTTETKRSTAPREGSLAYPLESPAKTSESKNTLGRMATGPSLIRCHSGRHSSVIATSPGHLVFDSEEPPFKRGPLGSLGGEDSQTVKFVQGTDIIQLDFPNHVLAGSGQVHVSAMVCYNNYLYCADGGAAGGRVCVYDLSSFKLVAWSTHWGILAMCCDEKTGRMFGSRSDGQMIVWDISRPVKPGRIIAQARICMPRVGHVLSLSLAGDHTLVIGSQDGYLRRLELPDDFGPTPAARPKQFAAADSAVLIDDILSTDYCERMRLCEVICGAPSSSSMSSGSSVIQSPPQQIASCNDCDITMGDQINSTLPVVAPDLQQPSASFAESSVNGSFAPATIQINPKSQTSVKQLVHPEMARSHCGFVTSVKAVGNFALSAGSCGLIKRWDVRTHACLETLGGHRGSVMDMVIREEGGEILLFSGSLDGTIRVWDITQPNTSHFLRAFVAHQSDPLTSLCLVRTPGSFDYLAAGSTSGAVWIWEISMATLLSTGDSPAVMLNVSSSSVNSLSYIGSSMLAVGAGSGRVSVWTLPEAAKLDLEIKYGSSPRRSSLSELQLGVADEAVLLNKLRDFVLLRTISTEPAHREECFIGAKFISSTLEKLDCEVRMCFIKKYGLPCVIGRMHASSCSRTPTARGDRIASSSRVVFVYGHYDVVPVSAREWYSDPWQLSGRVGYLYGRGVSDNKGPCLAMLFAAANLRNAGLLQVDVVFLFEGEGESALAIQDRNLSAVMSEHRDLLFGVEGSDQPVGLVISNNTWVGEDTPCVTYGMRGVLDLELSLESTKHPSDVHAGIHGGAVCEPMDDLVGLLHSFGDLKCILESETEAVSPEEMTRISRVANELEKCHSERPIRYDSASTFNTPGGGGNLTMHTGMQRLKSNTLASLLARWLNPSLSVSGIRTSNTEDSFRRVPHRATARVSIHLAPGLTYSRASELVSEFLHSRFEEIGSPNAMVIKVLNGCDPWTGKVASPTFQAMCSAVSSVWKLEPLLVREGGSYSGITSYLEKELKTIAVHLPMAQSADGAHLPDERIGVLHLRNGAKVFEEFLRIIGGS